MSLKIGAVPDKGRVSVRQSPTAHLPSNPSRLVIAAPSSSGKTNLIVSMLTTPQLYGGDVFDAVYVVSPSAKLDSTWQHLVKYRAKRGQKEEDFFMDSWDAKRIEQILDESSKLTAYHKAQQTKGEKRFATSVLLVVDDMADASHILHATGNSILNTLFIRGRHYMLSCWVSSQRPNLVSSIIRTQMSGVICFRMRNWKDKDTILTELSAWVNRKTLEEMYDLATRDKFSFLYVNLLAGDLSKTFYWNFDRKLIPVLEDESP